MCTPVFDNGPRDIAGGAGHLVSQFEYLNRSDRDEAERVRDLVEDMFSRYPVNAQETLRTRRPLAASPLGVDLMEVRDERLHQTAGASIAELLELPDGWPE